MGEGRVYFYAYTTAVTGGNQMLFRRHEYVEIVAIRVDNVIFQFMISLPPAYLVCARSKSNVCHHLYLHYCSNWWESMLFRRHEFIEIVAIRVDNVIF